MNFKHLTCNFDLNPYVTGRCSNPWTKTEECMDFSPGPLINIFYDMRTCLMRIQQRLAIRTKQRNKLLRDIKQTNK